MNLGKSGLLIFSFDEDAITQDFRLEYTKDNIFSRDIKILGTIQKF